MEWKQSIDNHKDWPDDNSTIDLTIHDLPHASSNIEWWYCHGHLEDETTHDPYSIFASFFRAVDNYRSTPEHICYLHAITWAIIDVKKQTYHCSTLIDDEGMTRLVNSPELYQELDKNLFEAYQELLKKNIVPLPDRLAKRPCFVALDKLFLKYDDNLFFKDEQNDYHLICSDPEQKMSFKLKMKPLKSVSRQVNNGLIPNGFRDETMFYYFIPRLACEGQLKIHNRSISVHGQTWYDHEFGGLIKYHLSSTTSPEISVKRRKSSQSVVTDRGWYWFGIQLDNNYDLTLSEIFDTNDHTALNRFILFIGPNNERIEYDGDDHHYQLEPIETWMSIRTGSIYPIKFHLKVPSIDSEFELEATFHDQELITILSRPAFWEGRLSIIGRMKDQVVKGNGFFECHGMNLKLLKPLDSFFRRMGQIVSKNIDLLLPKELHATHAIDLFVDQEHSSLIKTINLNLISQTIIKPLRDIIDRGGKAWRPYLFLLSIDCVGGDSRKYQHWTALAEIFHVGSLIIDDIEDESEIRRGGPACHLIYGTAQAINAGTMAYFLPMHTLMNKTSDLNCELKLQIYEAAFLTLRAAHLGQALDIHGLDYLMDEVVISGDSSTLEQSILSIHRLKSGVPAGCLARIGAMFGRAAKEQYQALEKYVQSLGVAFQIVDDILNLRGFEKGSKKRGEDLMAGKITFPVAKAMNKNCVNNSIQRRYIWDTIRSKTMDVTIINELIDIFEQCGAMDQSFAHATSLVNEAWLELDPLISDSFYKIILRAFGFHILERHY